MNLEVLYTPTVQTNDLYNCRVIGVSYPCLFSLRAITTAITGTGSRYIDGALFMEVSAATSSELGVNDLIKLDFAGTLVNSRILSIAEDAASPGTWLIETTYTAGSTPLNTFYLTSPADTVVNFIVNPSGKSEFILESRLDNDGVVNVDVAPALEQHLKTDDSFDYITQVYKEEELTIDFTVKYQILINGVALEAVPLEGVYTAVLAANQNLDSNDSNLIDYVPTGATPSAKFLNSESAKLPAWEGYPFWLDALFSDAVLNPEVSIVGDTVPITLDGKGLYRINGKQSWLAGVHGEICTTTTGTGDGVEPPPLKDVKVLTGYHFRGVAVSKPDLDPVDPVTPASCGQNYLANFKRFRLGYHAVNTIHEGFTLPSGEFIIFGLDASGGEAGFLEAWQFIAKSTPSGWEK